MFRCLVWAFALALLLPAPASAAPIYLALGDSSAFGETNRTQNPSNGDRGPPGTGSAPGSSTSPSTARRR